MMQELTTAASIALGCCEDRWYQKEYGRERERRNRTSNASTREWAAPLGQQRKLKKKCNDMQQHSGDKEKQIFLGNISSKVGGGRVPAVTGGGGRILEAIRRGQIYGGGAVC